MGTKGSGVCLGSHGVLSQQCTVSRFQEAVQARAPASPAEKTCRWGEKGLSEKFVGALVTHMACKGGDCTHYYVEHVCM